MTLAEHAADRFESATVVIDAINSSGGVVTAPPLGQQLLAMIAKTSSTIAGKSSPSEIHKNTISTNEKKTGDFSQVPKVRLL